MSQTNVPKWRLGQKATDGDEARRRRPRHPHNHSAAAQDILTTAAPPLETSSQPRRRRSRHPHNRGADARDILSTAAPPLKTSARPRHLRLPTGAHQADSTLGATTLATSNLFASGSHDSFVQIQLSGATQYAIMRAAKQAEGKGSAGQNANGTALIATSWSWGGPPQPPQPPEPRSPTAATTSAP